MVESRRSRRVRVVGSIGACVGAHVCVCALSHTGVHGVESDVQLTRSVDRLANPGDE
jgi:poly(3-hydroxyalkanoate) synthetase